MPPGIHRKEGIAGEVVTSRDAEGRCTKSRRWGLVHQKGAGGRFWMAAATRGCQRRPRSAPQGGSSGSTSCPSSSASVASSLIPRERVNFRAKTMMDELSGSRSGVGGHDHELLHRCAPTISPEDSRLARGPFAHARSCLAHGRGGGSAPLPPTGRAPACERRLTSECARRATSPRSILRRPHIPHGTLRAGVFSFLSGTVLS